MVTYIAVTSTCRLEHQARYNNSTSVTVYAPRMSKESTQELTSFRTASARPAGQRSPEPSASSSGSFKFWPFSKRTDLSASQTSNDARVASASAPPAPSAPASTSARATAVSTASGKGSMATTSSASSAASSKVPLPLPQNAGKLTVTILPPSGSTSPTPSTLAANAQAPATATQPTTLSSSRPSASSQAKQPLNHQLSSSKASTPSLVPRAHRRNLSTDLISQDLSTQVSRAESVENVNSALLVSRKEARCGGI